MVACDLVPRTVPRHLPWSCPSCLIPFSGILAHAIWISSLRTTSIATTHLLAKPLDSIIRKRSNSLCHFHCLAGNSTIQPFSVCEVFISGRSSTVRDVMFTWRVTSLITCIQFRLFVKEYLTNFHWLVDSDLFLAFWCINIGKPWLHVTDRSLPVICRMPRSPTYYFLHSK